MAQRHLERGYRALRRVVPHDRWQAVRRRVHPALRQSARRFASSVPNLGRISVVVPCYMVEEYLADCLTSIVSQTYPHLEIIVVIDGSPDGSAKIARGFARWDRRIRVVEQPNGGLGNARNTGIALATGDFIAFADSDDAVPTRAYATMVGTLAETGSDFAVGNLRRRQGNKSWVPKWAQDVHREDRLGLTLDDAPEILADVFSWNKLFRKPFFDAAVGRFPEGVRYEDQEPTARAYAAAKAFDVLSSVVYTWYIRGDGTSITQQKSNIRDLQDRLKVMRAVSGVLTREASPHVVEYWHAKSVGLDLRSYYNEVPRTGEDYWSLLREGVGHIAPNMDDVAWALVDMHDRVIARLIEKDARDDVCTVLRMREEYGDGKAVDPTTPQPTGAPPYLQELRSSLRPEDLILSPQENRLTAGLLGYRAFDDEIEITAMAYVDGVDLDAYPSTLEVRLVCEREQGEEPKAYPLHVRRTRMPAVDEVVNSASVSQAAAGFVATFGVSDFLSHCAPTSSDLPWHVEATLEVAGKRWTSRFRQWDRRWSANRLDHGRLVRGSRLVPRFSDQWGLEFSIRRAAVLADSATLQGRRLHLDLVPEPDRPVREVRASCTDLGLTVTHRPVPHGDTRRVTLTIPPLPPGAPPRKEHAWRLGVVTPEGIVPLDFGGGTSDLPVPGAGSGGLRIDLDAQGGLRLLDRRTHATVHEVSLAEWPEAFTVRGYASLPVGQQFMPALGSDTDLWEPTEAEHDPVSGEFHARFNVTEPRWGRDGLAHPTAGRSLRLLRHPRSTLDSLWVQVAPQSRTNVTSGFLEWHAGKVCDVRFTLSPRAGALWVNVRPHLEPEDVGRRAQLELARGVPSLLTRPLRDSALFSCFGGRQASDSPLAIHRELERRGHDFSMIWAVADHSVAIPPGAQSVVVGSAEYYEALHTSRWLVNNNNFPHYFRKHPGQRYVQTWHGTPLKRIGRDVPSTSLSLSYRALMEREVRDWDVLLAQNAFSATTLPLAFGYQGEVLELGYPRNDLLAMDVDARLRERIRTALGVHPAARLALYAPTWRDNRRTDSRQYALVNHLDLGQVSRAVGDTWTVLVRGHSNTPGLSAWSSYPNVVDVTDYPDIAELMMVADLLVTDYSSVMFDFVVTGKPIIFLVPDLEEYADRTRGFYLDFREIAPGPLLDSTEEVIAALASPSSATGAHSSRYESFRERFAPHDDGHAAERVVSATWDAER
jgi:CDP-glycerol glycerophosphotransferase